MYVSRTLKYHREGVVWTEGGKRLIQFVIPTPVKVAGSGNGSYLTADELNTSDACNWLCSTTN